MLSSYCFCVFGLLCFFPPIQNFFRCFCLEKTYNFIKLPTLFLIGSWTKLINHSYQVLLIGLIFFISFCQIYPIIYRCNNLSNPTLGEGSFTRCWFPLNNSETVKAVTLAFCSIYEYFITYFSDKVSRYWAKLRLGYFQFIIPYKRKLS